MNWSASKNVLICLFAAINILLISYLCYLQVQTQYIKDKSIENAISLLNSNNIHVEENAVAKWYPPMKSYQLKNIINEDYPLISKLDIEFNKKDNSYNDFEYEDKKFSCKLDGNNFAIKFAYNMNEGFLNLNSEKKSKLILKQLQDMDILPRANYKKYICDVFQTDNDFGFYIKNKRFVNENILKICYNKVGTIEISGVWFSGINETYKKANIISPIGPMMQFMNEHKVEAQSENIVITNVYPTFSVGDLNEYHKAATAIPCWCIEAKIGDKKASFCYEAISVSNFKIII